MKPLVQYPQQAIWHLVAGAKSKNRLRADRVLIILSKLKSFGSSGKIELSSFVQEALSLTDQLIAMCNNEVLDKKKSRFSLSKDFKNSLLPRMKNLKLIVPTQSALAPMLDENRTSSLATIAGFQDQFDVMSSLIRPKKITLLDSKGNRHHFLCKPKDDLRKDSRLMEFNGMINRLFKKDLEARKRNLCKQADVLM